MSMSFGWYLTLKLSIVKFLEVKLILYDIDYYNKETWNEQAGLHMRATDELINCVPAHTARLLSCSLYMFVL